MPDEQSRSARLTQAFRYEQRGQRPIPRVHFIRRLLAHFALAIILIFLSLALGIAGYEHYEHLSLTDAFLNAAMLLGGMGPVNPPATEGGKVFAGTYALFAGLIFLVVASIMIGPIAHRLLHRFHWDTKT